MWTATVVSFVDYWMYTAASGWLMTNLTSSPLLVSLVQAAASLPIFLFAMPAGALTDIVGRRQYLIACESAVTLFSIILAVLVWLQFITTPSLAHRISRRPIRRR
jgi:MFS family permease